MKTVFLLRHAEFDLPADGLVPDSTPLSGAGHARAKVIAQLLGRAGVTAVFASQAARTQQTARPLADQLALPVRVVPAQNGPVLLRQIFDPNSGPVVVVVGHSNTVPELVTGLGVSGPPQTIQGHTDLFVVTVAAIAPQLQAHVVRLTSGAAAPPAPVTVLGKVAFTGGIAEAEDLSAVELFGDLAVVGSDEGNKVQVLKRDGGGYTLSHDVVLNAAAEEVDVEGITHAAGTVYVIGSHSAKRKKVKSPGDDAKPHPKNRAALEKVTPEPDRDLLCRFTVAADGSTSAVEATTLRAFFNGHPIFDRFQEIPGKENGIDIEGLAFHDGRLYVGFRGPVLREGWVPVLRCKFVTPEVKKDDGELLFVHLDGYGVRDLVRAGDGFLVLAGPVGDVRAAFRLYWWDGSDCLPGVRADNTPRGRTVRLGDVPAEGESKPEGMTLLSEDATGYDLLAVYDTVVGGNPTRLRVSKA